MFPFDLSPWTAWFTGRTSLLAAFFSSSWNCSGMSCSNGKALMYCRWLPEKGDMEQFETSPSQCLMSDVTYFFEFIVGKCDTDEYLAIFVPAFRPKCMFIPSVWELWSAVQEPDSAVSSVHHQNPWGTRWRSKLAEPRIHESEIRGTKSITLWAEIGRKNSSTGRRLSFSDFFLQPSA